MRPALGILAVIAFAGLVIASDYAMDRGFEKGGLERVGPDAQRQVRIEVGDLEVNSVRFYRFLNEGNQEVKFFVGRDAAGEIHAAFDANEICFKKQRGYTAQGDWLVCNWCDKSFRLAEVNQGGGGCRPVPLTHRLEGEAVILDETDILAGWRFFR